MEIANNLKKNGGFIPGFRPGKPDRGLHRQGDQQDYLLWRHLSGHRGPAAHHCRQYHLRRAGVWRIGGTSVIIVVGVALETVQALEAQMLMRHYKGFLE